MNPELETASALAVLYRRVSTGEQAEHGTSLEHQESVNRAEAARLCATIAGEFGDPGVSGASYLSRPGIQAALGRAEELAARYPEKPIYLILMKCKR